MKFLKAVCFKCKKYYNHEQIYRCTECGSPIDIIYDYEPIKEKITSDFKKQPISHVKYSMFYPTTSKVFTMDEGGTSLYKSSDIKGLFFKYEGVNPSGSFKDRGSSIEITKALEFKAKEVYCASTGNMGASVAMYSAKAGLNYKIFLPKGTSGAKLRQIKVFGGSIVRDTSCYDFALKEAEACYLKNKRHHVFIAGDYVYRAEGQKSIGFEIADQFKWDVPDYIICPIGNGTLMWAVWKAFKELIEVGLTDKLPIMVGVQAKGASSVVSAFKNHKPIKPIFPRTKAGAIEVGYPIYGEQVIDLIKESKGFLDAVSDDEMIGVRSLLAKKQGIFTELAGAASFASFLKNKTKFEGKSVVCLVTGNGLKDFY